MFENLVPFSNIHELNLDWIIAKVKEYIDKTDLMEINFEDLKKYVTDYFDDLDVQEEINNKLDEMLENGELASLIAQFLSTESLLVFNTIADLVSAENLVNGVSVLTLGEQAYNDGLTHMYKIRTLTSGDVIDGVNIIALTNYPTLIAERLPVDESKKYVFIGDSYLAGWTDDQGTIDNYGNMFKNKMGLVENVNYFAISEGGTGFGALHDDRNFTNLVNDIANTMTASQKNSITDVIVMGGRNDANSGVTEEMISNGTDSLITSAMTHFPNAKIYFGVIGWSKNFEIISNLNQRVIRIVTSKLSSYKNVLYLNNIEYTLVNKTLLDTVGNHPNIDGQKAICKNLIQCLETGACATHTNAYATMTPENGITITGSLFENVDNSLLSICFYNVKISASSGITIGTTPIKICKLENDMLFGNIGKTFLPMSCVLRNTANVYINRIVRFEINNGDLLLAMFNANEQGNNYETLTINELQTGKQVTHIGTYSQI